jgi:hypothetical protein
VWVTGWHVGHESSMSSRFFVFFKARYIASTNVRQPPTMLIFITVLLYAIVHAETFKGVHVDET